MSDLNEPRYEKTKQKNNNILLHMLVVVLGFYVPPTAKVIRRRDLGLKSHPKDWRSPGSNSGPLVYKAGSLTARPRRVLYLLHMQKQGDISTDQSICFRSIDTT